MSICLLILELRLQDQSLPDTWCSFLAQAKDKGLVDHAMPLLLLVSMDFVLAKVS